MTRLRPILPILILAFLVFSLAAQSTATLVYYTPKGKAYHVESCRTLKKSKSVLSCTVAEAKGMGLSACKVCKP